MRVWRISKQAYALSCLTGTGGLYASGRWHHQGRPIVYTASNAALAALEMLVHTDPLLAPSDLRLVEIEVPATASIEACDPAALVSDWRRYPGPRELRDFGTAWLAAQRTLVLRVPSAVLDAEPNYLLNPAHPEMSQVRILADNAFSFDPRLR